MAGNGRQAETVGIGAADAPGSGHSGLPVQPWLLACALAAAGAVTVAAALVAILAPGLRPLLLLEDGIVETATAVCLGIAVLGTGAAIGLWGLRAPLILAGLIALAELMDETSFGSRIFGFEPPPLYGGGQLDGFHDLLILAYRLLGAVSPDLAWLWLGLILLASVAILLFALKQVGNRIGGTGSWLSGHVLLFLHVGLIGLAQVIDLATSSHLLSASNVLSAMEETFELDASLLLVFYVAQQAYESWAGTSPRMRTSL